MSFFPDIEEGKIKEVKEPKLYTPPAFKPNTTGEQRLAELNNLGRKEVSEDFSDSPHLDI